jgi:hypothetical protein
MLLMCYAKMLLPLKRVHRLFKSGESKHFNKSFTIIHVPHIEPKNLDISGIFLSQKAATVISYLVNL